MKRTSLILLFLLVLGLVGAKGDDFFDITHVKFYQNPPANEPAVYHNVTKLDQNSQPVLGPNQIPVTKQVFALCLQVRVSNKESVKANALFAKAYFYDGNKNMISKAIPPSFRKW